MAIVRERFARAETQLAIFDWVQRGRLPTSLLAPVPLVVAIVMRCAFLPRPRYSSGLDAVGLQIGALVQRPHRLCRVHRRAAAESRRSNRVRIRRKSARAASHGVERGFGFDLGEDTRLDVRLRELFLHEIHEPEPKHLRVGDECTRGVSMNLREGTTTRLHRRRLEGC